MATVSRRPGRPPNRNRSGAQYTVGQQVLCRWTDGLFYLASICRVDDKGLRCYVQFEDDSEYWVLTKDIQKGAIRGEIYCCICQGGTSTPPNEIVLCDNCGLGYHQLCHNPPIEPDILKPSVEFFCRLCVFATTVKRGGALKKGPNVKAFQAMKLSLPYKLSQLTWDPQHKTNTEECYCYCGGPGEWFRKMLQCCRCRQWFHEACIQCLLYPLICGDRFYVFVCSHCNLGPEYIQRLDMTWRDVVHLALFSLTMHQGVKYYDLEDAILPWIQQRWEPLQIPNLEKPSLKELLDIVVDVLHTHKARFSWAREIKKRSSLWGLRDRVPPPAPTITLPTDGRVTDAVINTLNTTLAGRTRRGRSFETEQCESPVPLRMMKGRCAMDMDTSIVFKSKRAKKLLMDASRKSRSSAGSSQEHRSHANIVNGHEFGSPVGASPQSPSTSRSPRSSGGQCQLDTVIPPPPCWGGCHHPFKTALECQEEAARQRRLQECLKTLADSAVTAQVQQKQASALIGGLEVYAPTPPTSSSSSPRSASEVGDDLKPPVLHAVQPRPRGRPRKLPPSWEGEGPPQLIPLRSPGRIGRPRRNRMPVLSPTAVSQAVAALAQANGVVGPGPPRPQSLHLNRDDGMMGLTRLKPPTLSLLSKTGSAATPSPRLPDGRKFEVLARRTLSNGTAQFLVHWPGTGR